MRDLANDLAHIFFVIAVLGLTHYGLWGFVLSGLLIGLLIELKEEDSNILHVAWNEVSPRDILGYMTGGFIIGLIMKGW